MDSAWVEFSDSLDDFRLAALKMGARKDQSILDDPRYPDLAPSCPETWEARQRELHIVTTVERANLLYRIYSGDLWAIGCQTMEDGFDRLTRVPRELFFIDPDEAPFHDGIYWAKGQLTIDDQSYFDIRVAKPVDASDDSDSLSSRGEVRNSTGRVGRRKTEDEIRSKIEELWLDPAFHAMRDRTEQAREVRAHLHGEDFRLADEMQNYRTSTIKLLIGRVATEHGQGQKN